MPRTIVEPRSQVEHLSILDADGQLDAVEVPAERPRGGLHVEPVGAERREDGGHACVRMATGLERTREKSELYRSALAAMSVPVQVLWGIDDPVLKVDVDGKSVSLAAGVPLVRLPGKHFLQEDCFEAIGERIARLAAAA